MVPNVSLESGFAEVGAGAWLVGHAQPAACFGEAVRRRRKGWVVRDRGRLDLVETTGSAKCADSTRPFLTHIPCAAPISAVSDKVLVAPASARSGAEIIRPIPFSVKSSICVTTFAQPVTDMVKHAAQLMKGLISKEQNHQHVTFQPLLMRRESC